MGFRIQKRINLFGGLGLNISKSGISWSVRTLFGATGPKGYSIRSGIPGLTYRSSVKETVNRVEIIVPTAKNEMTVPFKTTDPSYQKTSPVKIDRINLEQDIIIYIDNLCGDITDLIKKALNEQTLLSQAIYTAENLKSLVIYDFCKIFYHLNISVYENRVEKDILLVACGHLIVPQFTVELLNDELEVYEKCVRAIDGAIGGPHPLNLDASLTPFALPEVLKDDESLYGSYKCNLLDFAALITTSDFNLTKQEAKIIKLVRKL